MKKNNQGFMLVEALVMSTVIIGVLVFMFIQFQNISRGYDKSFSYNTVTGLYITNEIKTYLTNGSKVETLITSLNSDEEDYVKVTYTDVIWNELISKGNIKNVIFADEGLTGLKGSYNNTFSETLNDYINYVKVNDEVNKYRIIVEFNDDTYASLKIGG